MSTAGNLNLVSRPRDLLDPSPIFLKYHSISERLSWRGDKAFVDTLVAFEANGNSGARALCPHASALPVVRSRPRARAHGTSGVRSRGGGQQVIIGSGPRANPERTSRRRLSALRDDAYGGVRASAGSPVHRRTGGLFPCSAPDIAGSIWSRRYAPRSLSNPRSSDRLTSTA